MKRLNWKMEYTGAALREGAQKKFVFHTERLKVWTERKAKIMQEIKDKGLSIDMGNTDIYAASNDRNAVGYTRGVAAPTVKVDYQMQANMQEAHAKVAVHQNALWEYKGWIESMSAKPEQTFKLNHDDWLYFFGSSQQEDKTND